jgi:hypothetical protein
VTKVRVLRVNQGGNYCGHKPLSPRFATAWPQQESRPLTITRLVERLQDFYWKPIKTIPLLKKITSTRRQQRSERREAIYLILAIILEFTDLATLLCGTPDGNGGIDPFPVADLAEKAGITLRRAERAMADLRRVGLLTVAERAEEKPDGKRRAIVAIKAVSWRLWDLFGMADMLRHERPKASARTRKLRIKASSARDKAKAGHAMDIMRRTIAGIPRRGKAERSPEEARAYNLLLAELAQRHPDWSSDQIRFEANQRLA